MLFALHVPDHTLTAEVSLAAAALVVLAVCYIVKRFATGGSAPSWGLFAGVVAFVFAAQLLNFPLIDGRTSGHVLGAAAAVLLLGPAYGVPTMALVLVVQAVLLGDGGVTALGANTLNMAVIAPLTTLVVAGFVRRRRDDAVGVCCAAFAAGWASTVVAALACAGELAASGVVPFGATAASLVGRHAVLGLVEGAVTAALVAMPALSGSVSRRRNIVALAFAAALVFALTPLSSQLPDTLDAVLATTGNAN